MSDPAVIDVIVPAAPAVVEIITEGPQGPAGGILGYLHTQASPASTWTINHNLGLKPVVALYSVGGVEFDAQVTHVSDNQCVVSLATAVAGFARCN